MVSSPRRQFMYGNMKIGEIFILGGKLTNLMVWELLVQKSWSSWNPEVPDLLGFSKLEIPAWLETLKLGVPELLGSERFEFQNRWDPKTLSSRIVRIRKLRLPKWLVSKCLCSRIVWIQKL